MATLSMNGWKSRWRAITDQAVVQFATLPLLLAQLPDDLRVAVSRAFDAYSPFVEGTTFYVAHLRVDTVCAGRWGICRSTSEHAGYGLLVACDQARYDETIQQIHAVFATQRDSIPRD